MRNTDFILQKNYWNFHDIMTLFELEILRKNTSFTATKILIFMSDNKTSRGAKIFLVYKF